MSEALDRIEAAVKACEGLTPEQVAAIPRLIAWFLDDGPRVVEHDELMDIFDPEVQS